MLALLKKDVLVNFKPLSIYLAGLIFLALFIDITFIYMLWSILSLIILFMNDQKAKTIHFLIGLPIEKVMIIRSRYVYLLMESAFLLLILWLVNITSSASYRNDTWYSMYEVYMYRWEDIAAIFSVVLFIYAVSIPIFYMTKSLTVVNSFSFGLLAVCLVAMFIASESAEKKYNGAYFTYEKMEGSMAWLKEIIMLPPSLFLFISFMAYGVSMKISEKCLDRTTL